MTIMLICAGAVVVVLLLVWLSARVPPEDPWYLEHGHTLAHHYSKDMERGTVDHDLQESAAEKREARDARIGRIQREHTEVPPVRPATVVRMRKTGS